MKKNALFLLALTYVLFSCNKESGSISGSWVTEMDEQPQHKSGFTLKDEGTASSINLNDKDYQKWEKQGNRLILFGKIISNEHNLNFTDTLKIISVSDSTMVLEKSQGEKITYTKTISAEKLISKFQTYACYAYMGKKDTAFMHINIADSIVTGNLKYAIFEKDSNDGTLQGKLKNDTLLANYTFVSEGVESVREVVFLKKGDDWLEGFGEVEEKAGSVIFKDKTKLKFRNGMLFKMTECP
ncbi:lipocalin family protein [Dyadobacter sp. NIV53]|uniref:lipocalin family protein n=1 Tax=Dyadobacter sp. NIV53 TaxID=2861765 RepID=UPI001C879E98|nr:lipocalin family protein [Dyadobacter sp. NIV53]